MKAAMSDGDDDRVTVISLAGFVAVTVLTAVPIAMLLWDALTTINY